MRALAHQGELLLASGMLSLQQAVQGLHSAAWRPVFACDCSLASLCSLSRKPQADHLILCVQGLLGLVSYTGAANAGIPLSYVLKHHGWDGYFMVMAASSVAALLLLVPLANAPSFVQLQRRQVQKAA